jgi:hypothetical protein
MCLPAALVSLAVLTGVPAAFPAPPRVTGLIAQLGSPDFLERETASKELETIGGPALAALKAAAAASTDMEVARRAAVLHDRVAHRVDNERTLAAARVELAVEDTPLADLAAELEKQTGYRLVITSPALGARKVSLKTAGKVPFWEAIARLCEEAGAEVESVTPGKPRPLTGAAAPAVSPAPPAARTLPDGAIPDVQRELIELAKRRQAVVDEMQKKIEGRLKDLQKAAGDEARQKAVEQLRQQQAEMQRLLRMLADQQAQQVAANRANPVSAGQPGTVLLRPGVSRAYPVSISGAVRIESVPTPGWVPAVTPRDTVVAVLNFTAEPRLTWELVESVRVTRAIDPTGRNLTTIPAITNTANLKWSQVVDGRIVLGFDGGVNLVPGSPPSPGRPGSFAPGQAVVRLTCDSDSPPTLLKDLEGVVRARVRTAAEEIVAVDGLDAHATPPAVGGPAGVVLKVNSVSPVEGTTDRFELDVSVHYNPALVQVADAGTPAVTERVIQQGAGRVIVRQQMAGGVIVFGANARGFNGLPGTPEVPAGQSAFGLSVLGTNGKPFTLTVSRSVRQYDQTGLITDQVQLIARGSGKPAKVAFTGTRSKTVEVPFRFTDLPVTAGAGPVTGK